MSKHRPSTTGTRPTTSRRVRTYRRPASPRILTVASALRTVMAR